MRTYSGKIWKFGDDVDTDAMYPSNLPVIKGGITLETYTKYCMRAIRPEWADLVRPGDIIVAGKNFGCGSARDASGVLKMIGIKVIVAKSFSRIFFRNATNNGILLVENAEIQDNCTEEDILEVNVNHSIKVHGSTKEYAIPTIPEDVLQTVELGGLLNKLRISNGLEPIGG